MISVDGAHFHPHTGDCRIEVHLYAVKNVVWCGHCGEVIWPDAAAVDISISNLHLLCESGVGIWRLPDLEADLHRCHRTVTDEEVAAVLDLAYVIASYPAK